MFVKFSSHFRLSPDDVLCVNSKLIDILLGMDAAALLLDKLFVLNGRKIGPPMQCGPQTSFSTAVPPALNSRWWAE